MTMERSNSIIAAVIVAYKPEITKIQRLIERIRSQVDHIIVTDNGSQPELRAYLERYSGLAYLDMHRNAGVGAALNAGWKRATAMGCSHVITFDHDSNPANDMVEKLLVALEQLRLGGRSVAAVGPSFIDQRQVPPMRYPFYRRAGCRVKRFTCDDGSLMVEVDALITSGCLYPIAAVSAIKQFDEGYFVDYIDTDWCFYARSLGFSLFGVCDAHMEHELGSGESRSFASIRLIEYKPLRRYYYFRNTLLFIRRPYVPSFWKVKLLFGLLVRILMLPVTPGDRIFRQLRMMLKGIAHGLAGITGPISEAGGRSRSDLRGSAL